MLRGKRAGGRAGGGAPRATQIENGSLKNFCSESLENRESLGKSKKSLEKSRRVLKSLEREKMSGGRHKQYSNTKSLKTSIPAVPALSGGSPLLDFLLLKPMQKSKKCSFPALPALPALPGGGRETLEV